MSQHAVAEAAYSNRLQHLAQQQQQQQQLAAQAMGGVPPAPVRWQSVGTSAGRDGEALAAHGQYSAPGTPGAHHQALLAEQQQRHMAIALQQKQQQQQQQWQQQQQLLAEQQQRRRQFAMRQQQVALQQQLQQQSAPSLQVMRESPHDRVSSAGGAADLVSSDSGWQRMPPPGISSRALSQEALHRLQQQQQQQHAQPGMTYQPGASPMAQHAPSDVQRQALLLQQQQTYQRQQGAATPYALALARQVAATPNAIADSRQLPAAQAMQQQHQQQLGLAGHGQQPQPQQQQQLHQKLQHPQQGQAPTAHRQAPSVVSAPPQPSKVELPLPVMTPCIVFPADLEAVEGKRLRMALQSSVSSELAWALNVLALASCSGATPLELRHHPDLLPILLKVLEDDLSGARLGYIKTAGFDANAQDPAFVGPPCKRPRLAVDAPQGEVWEHDEAIIAPFGDPEQRRSQDDASQAVGVSNILRNWALMPGSERLLAEATCVHVLARTLDAVSHDGGSAAAELAGNLLDVLQRVCAAVQLDSGSVGGALLAALCSYMAPDQLLPHRTAAATALAAFASQPANANGICMWLCSPASRSPCSAEGQNPGEDDGGAALADGPAQQPQTAGTAQNVNSRAEPVAASVASKHSRLLLGHVAGLITCSAAVARDLAAAGVGKGGAAAMEAAIDGVAQALQAAAIQAGTAALCALVRSCSTAASSMLTACPVAVRAVVFVATGSIEPTAQYKLAVPLKLHIAKLMQHARQEACGAITALASAPMPVPKVLQPYAGQLSAAALQGAPGAGSLVTAVSALARDTLDAEE